MAVAAIAAAVAVPVASGTAKEEVSSRIAAMSDINVYLELSGSTQSGESAAVICETGGKVDELHVKPGDTVSKGEKLASIITAAETDEQSVSAMAEANAANSALSEAKQKIKEQARSVGCDLNTFNAYMSGKQQDVPVFEEGLEVTTQLASPISGKVISVDVSEGGYIAQGTAAVVVADTSSCVIKAMVNEDDIDFVYTGMPASFTLEGKSGMFSGSVTAVSDAVTLTGTQKKQVEIEITPAEKLAGIIGRSANVNLLVKSAQGVLSVPVDAVCDGSVFVIGTSGTLEKRTVETGLTNGMDIEITSGLYYGERVVLYPSDKLEDGMAVKTVD